MSDLRVRPQDLGIGRLFESVRDAVIVADVGTGRIVLWNPAATEIFGYPASEALEMTVDALVPDHLKERHRSGMYRYRETGRGRYIDSRELLELPAMRKGGEEIYVEMSLSPIEPVEDMGFGTRLVLAIVRDVTGRKRAEAALRSSEAELRALFNAMTDVVLVLDREGRYLEIAPTNPSLLYRPPGELVGKTVHEVFPKEQADTFLRSIRRTLETRRATQIEYSLKIGGRETWFASTISPMSGDSVVWVARDITERKHIEEEVRRLNEDLEARIAERTAWLENALAARERAEEELRSSRDELEIILEGVADGITAQDTSGRLVYVNDAAARILGYDSARALLETPVEEVMGRFEVLDEEGNPFPLAKLPGRNAIQSRQRAEATLRLRNRASGDERWTLVVATPVFDSRGEVRFEVNIFHDITERKRAEERIAFQAQLLEQVSAAVIATDMHGVVLYWNRHAERLYGWTREEVIGRNINEFTVGPVETTRVGEILEQLRAGRAWEGEFTVRRRDGSTFPAYVTDSLIYDSHGNAVGIVGVSTDIGERKRLEEALFEIREAERRRIARDLHDVVLQDLVGALQGLQAVQIESRSSGLDVCPVVEALRAAVGRLRDAVYDLRLEGTTSFLRAAESLVELNNQMAPDCQTRLVVQDGFPQDLPEAESVELLRILREALANVRRHAAARNARVTLSRTGSELRIEVADDGVGFDPNVPRDGIGLDSMRERVAALGGELEVESAPGKGARIAARVPLASRAGG